MTLAHFCDSNKPVRQIHGNHKEQSMVRLMSVVGSESLSLYLTVVLIDEIVYGKKLIAMEDSAHNQRTPGLLALS